MKSNQIACLVLLISGYASNASPTSDAPKDQNVGFFRPVVDDGSIAVGPVGLGGAPAAVASVSAVQLNAAAEADDKIKDAGKDAKDNVKDAGKDVKDAVTPDGAAKAGEDIKDAAKDAKDNVKDAAAATAQPTIGGRADAFPLDSNAPPTDPNAVAPSGPTPPPPTDPNAPAVTEPKRKELATWKKAVIGAAAGVAVGGAGLYVWAKTHREQKKLKDQIKALEASNAALTEQLSQAKENVVLLENKLEGLQRRLTDNEVENMGMKDTLELMKGDRKTFKKNEKALMDRLSLLSEKLKALGDKRKDISSASGSRFAAAAGYSGSDAGLRAAQPIDEAVDMLGDEGSDAELRADSPGEADEGVDMRGDDYHDIARETTTGYHFPQNQVDDGYSRL